MQPKTVTQSLLDRLHYWENELDIDRSAHPEPAARLDSLLEQMIDDEAMALSALSELRSENMELTRQADFFRQRAKALTETNSSLVARNKALESRWTTLRRLLGIEQGREDWS